MAVGFKGIDMGSNVDYGGEMKSGKEDFHGKDVEALADPGGVPTGASGSTPDEEDANEGKEE
jgi:hypothetical protein